ncbi:MAG: MerR family transcriptional regulator [Litorivicinus sp.]
MDDLFSINELADTFEISARAIRFYEDKGLLAPTRVGSRRVYTRRDRARLQLILRGKRLGFSLGEIAEYLDLYDQDPTQVAQSKLLLEKVAQRRSALEQQLVDIRDTLADLDDIQRQIQDRL